MWSTPGRPISCWPGPPTTPCGRECRDPAGRRAIRDNAAGDHQLPQLFGRPPLRPGNLHFGPLVGFDEHVIEPGAGFAIHAHRGVDIISWVLEGALTHEDSLENKQIVTAGGLALMTAGSGVRHEERNDGPVPLRVVQATLLAESGSPAYALVDEPADIGAVVVRTLRPGGEEISLDESQLLHLFAGRGDMTIAGFDPLRPGDALRVLGPEVLAASAAEGALVQLLAARIR